MTVKLRESVCLVAKKGGLVVIVTRDALRGAQNAAIQTHVKSASFRRRYSMGNVIVHVVNVFMGCVLLIANVSKVVLMDGMEQSVIFHALQNVQNVTLAFPVMHVYRDLNLKVANVYLRARTARISYVQLMGFVTKVAKKAGSVQNVLKNV